MNRRFLSLLVVSVVSVQLSTAAMADEKKTRAIQQLIAIETGGKIGQEFVNQMISSMKAQLPQVPEDFWKSIAGEINTKELEDALVGSYDKYFSEQQIKDMINFYGTPTGKRLLEVRPQVSTETFQFTQSWAAKISNLVIGRLREKGFIPQPQQQPAAQPQR